MKRLNPLHELLRSSGFEQYGNVFVVPDSMILSAMRSVLGNSVSREDFLLDLSRRNRAVGETVFGFARQLCKK